MVDKVKVTENMVEEILKEVLKAGSGADFSKVLVLLPNRRPSYYLHNSLSQSLGKSFFPPLVLSITDFIEYIIKQIKPASVPVGKLDEIWLLYKLLKGLNLFGEFDFHRFYFWGEKITSVLDELEMEDVPFNKLKNLPSENIPSEARKVISRIGEIKTAFRKTLEEHNFHTGSMAYRIVSEFLGDSIVKGWEKIIIAGFYRSTKLEQKILDFICKQEKTVNIKRKEMYVWNTDRISIHNTFDVHSQVKAAGDIIRSLNDFSSVALVMPQPDALVPVLWNILEDLGCPYNVTMGYPLKRTPVFTFLNELMKLQETMTADGYYAKSYLSVLLHPYVKNAAKDIAREDLRMLIQSVDAKLTEENRSFVKLEEIELEFPLLKSINTLVARTLEGVVTTGGLSQAFSEILSFVTKYSFVRDYPFTEEFLECVFRILDELSEVLCRDESMKKEDLFNLFRYHADNTRIPFSGIPLSGLQIMGLLETRNLKFKKVIIMDVQEGVLPSVSKADPLLPESVRDYLGLPLCKDREDVTRRHFMDLVNSAGEAHLIYSEHDRDIKSRFIEEIIWEKQKKDKTAIHRYKKDGEFISLTRFETKINAVSFIPVIKTPEIIEELLVREYSPSSINSYLGCPAQFYFKYVLGLKEKEEMSEDPDSSQIGTCVHSILKILFSRFKEKPYNEIYGVLKNMLEETVEEEVQNKFGHLKGNIYLIKEIIKFRLKYMLERQQELGDFTVFDMEKELKAELEGIACKSDKIRLKGIIDRIDCRQGEIFIVDYKTGEGKHPHMRKKFSGTLTDRKEIKDFVKSFQLPVYAYLVKSNYKEYTYDNIDAAFYNMKNMEEKRIFSKDAYYSKERSRTQVMEEIFLPFLRTVISEILNPNFPFEADKDDKDNCKYCVFSSFCA